MSHFDELRRDSYHPDAVRKAAEQEAFDRADERAPHTASRHDVAGHTVVRRTSPEGQGQGAGGAVTSRRGGVGALVGRKLRARQKDPQARPAARSARPRPERPMRRQPHQGGPLRALAVFVLALVALYLLICGPIDRTISFSREERAGLSRELSWHVPGMPYYVLALGSDAREGEDSSRTDTMILVRVDPLAAKLTMLSIPRDTMVQLEGQGTQKINAAYTFGGVAGAVRAVHDLTGAPISHAALVRFDGIEELVDYLGGVTVNVPVEVYDPEYTGLILPAGEQEMDGQTALLYSRVRHGFALGDYQRQKDQRVLIEAIMHESLALPPHRMPGIVSHMGGFVGTSMRMYSLMPLMLRLKLAGNVTIYQATVPSTSQMVDGVSYEVTDTAALAELMDVIDAGGDPAAESSSN